MFRTFGINVRGASSGTDSGPEPIHALTHLGWSGQPYTLECKDTFLDQDRSPGTVLDGQVQVHHR